MPVPLLSSTETASRIQHTASLFFRELGRLFPVCSTSDEFHYFPHLPSEEVALDSWDDYSPATVARFLQQLRQWKEQLEILSAESLELTLQIDLSLLLHSINSLLGELGEIQLWRRQPSFYLTLAAIGLAQTFDLNCPSLFTKRLAGLPPFLDQAVKNLEEVPTLFRDLALKMSADFRSWLLSRSPADPPLSPVLAALEQFEQYLHSLPPFAEFRLPPPHLDKVVRHHLAAEQSLAEVQTEIEAELEEMKEILEREASSLFPGQSWQEALLSLPLPPLPKDALLPLYRQEVRRLEQHCLALGLISESLAAQAPVRVEPVPLALASLRGVAVYSVIPRHPPAGGFFYLLLSRLTPKSRRLYQREASLLCAHETFPGHHLLDIHRWNLANPLRRCLEYPLFYEGWACFAEDFLFQTGFFSSSRDRLILARRHYWRAIRGKIDLLLQQPGSRREEAAALFASTGMDLNHARKVVRTYPLKPGYQICYTLGRRRFRRLFERYGRQDPAAFARLIFQEGEILFKDLEKVMSQAAPGSRGE